jgi:hypothetical protein
MGLMRDERGARQGVAKQKGYKTRPAVRLEYCVKRRLLYGSGAVCRQRIVLSC